MRKATWLLISILIIAVFVLFVIRQNYKDSPDYNYITAKLDIKNGNIKIISLGFQKDSLKYNEAAKKYGFKNIFIENDPTEQIKSGINNYNEVMEGYLKVRNGLNWRNSYQNEIDSLLKQHL